VPFSWW